MNSLERSLQVGLVVSLVALLLLFWWAGALASRLLTESVVFNRLETEAAALLPAVAVVRTPDGGLSGELRAEAVRLSEAYNRLDSGQYYQVVFGPDRQVSSPSMDGLLLPDDPLAPGERQRLRLSTTGGKPLLLWRAGFAREGLRFTLALAEDVSPIESRLVAFQWFFAAISLALVLSLVAVQHVIVRRSVRKLDLIRDEIRRLEQGQLAQLSEDVPEEILPLVREFNRLLTRFEQRLRQSRNAVGNLAHTLKGPLNLLLRASKASHDGSADEPAIVRQNAERIHQLIESELKRARLAGRGTVGQRFDLEAELPPLCGLLSQVYADKAVDVRFTVGPGTELFHDRQDMLELFGNLLDNAVKWARSVVILHVRNAGGILIEVEDDGPGCSAEELHTITDRGVRLDESIAGHGLGLAIVRDIISSYHGTLEFGESTRLGGLRVSVLLPNAPAT